MPEMIKCQHCGTFVPAEKAFCPNCSEPMEVEERPNRAHSFSADMMSTIRDDPEKYKELFLKPPAKNKTAPTTAPPQAKADTPAPAANTGRATPASPPVTNYNNWPSAPAPVPVPVTPGNSKRNLVLGISVIALLAVAIVLLFVFKVI